jgi:predicted Zn-ribbon and HTH transcriptional regulator
MSNTEQFSITPLCPQCDSEGLTETDNSEYPIKCQECGFETTEEHVFECNEGYIKQKTEEHAKQLIDEHFTKPLKKLFK